MSEKTPRAIFGLNFLQDMKSDSATAITGAYDAEQELWVVQGQVQASPFETTYRLVRRATQTQYDGHADTDEHPWVDRD